MKRETEQEKEKIEGINLEPKIDVKMRNAVCLAGLNGLVVGCQTAVRVVCGNSNRRRGRDPSSGRSEGGAVVYDEAAGRGKAGRGV